MSGFGALLSYQYKILLNNRYILYNQIVFLLINIIAFPLLIEKIYLPNIGLIILLMSCYLTISIYQSHLWIQDNEDGTLDQLLIFTQPFWIILTKFLILWVSSSFLFCLMLPVVKQLYNLHINMETLLIGVLLYNFSINAITSGGVLLCLHNSNYIGMLHIICLPLCIISLLVAYSFCLEPTLINLSFAICTALLNIISLLLLGPYLVRA